MSKKAWIIGGVAVVAVIGATIIGRSLAGAPAKEGETASSAEVITLKVAHTQNYVPYDFVNEKGESDGYEVAVLKAVDEKLANYQFEYTGTSDDDLLIGLESGKTSEPRVLGTQMNELKSLSFHLNQWERASSDLLSEKKMNRNTKPLMTLLRIKGNWFLSLHRMLNGMSSPAIMKNIRMHRLS